MVHADVATTMIDSFEPVVDGCAWLDPMHSIPKY